MLRLGISNVCLFRTKILYWFLPFEVDKLPTVSYHTHTSYCHLESANLFSITPGKVLQCDVTKLVASWVQSCRNANDNGVLAFSLIESSKALHLRTYNTRPEDKVDKVIADADKRGRYVLQFFPL